jgi:cytochrome c oxidase subunit IV
MNQINKEEIAHSPGYKIYFLVWMALLILTGVTVAVAGVNLANITVAVAMIIACIKAYLVLSVFMHLKYEGKMFSIFVGVALLFIIITLALLFSDYSFM